MTDTSCQKINELESDDDFEDSNGFDYDDLIDDKNINIMDDSSEDDEIEYSKQDKKKRLNLIDDDSDDEEPQQKQSLIEKIFSILPEVKSFVDNNYNILNQLQTNWNEFSKIFNAVKEQKKDICKVLILKLIYKSLKNIKKYNNQKKHSSQYQKKLMANNVNDIMIAIQTFFNFMLKEKNKLAKEIEQSLFKLIFNPIDYGSLRTTIYSVYSIHDTLLTTDKSFFNFKSSTGSGKTRCAPFFFSIKSIEDDLKRPFFIMTQPSRSIINDKVCDFKRHLKNQVEIVVDIGILYNKYKEIKNNGKNKFAKPIIALLSSINLLKLIIKTQKKRYQYIQIH